MKPIFYAIAFLLLSCSVNAQDSTRVRVATYNCSLNRDSAGALISDLSNDNNLQVRKVAQIIQTIRPDVILLNEFDFDSGHKALELFKENYLSKGWGGREPIDYQFSFTAEVNTGIDTQMDLNADGKLHSAEDAFGFGAHPGQYGMVVLSRYPIQAEQIRTFQKFKWADMPGGLWPIVPSTGLPYYNDDIKKVFRLSSKSHWDIPITVNGQTVHLLVSHPTPPVFDKDEDKNGGRNHDEIRFWADYVGDRNEYIYDDAGNKGGLANNASFVIAGDQNADPADGDNRDHAIRQLLGHPRIQDPSPKSAGGSEQAEKQGGRSIKHKGDSALDTGDFNDERVGNLRIDYVLPSKNLKVQGAGVFWPLSTEPDFALIDASDHRAVWVDIEIK